MAPDAPADIVLTGGTVYTVDAARPRAGAIAARAGRIVAVGNERDIKGHIGPRTRVVDLTGRMVVPGFQDAHVHPVHGGLNQLRCELRGARGREGYLELIAAYATAHPDRPWIVGGGWYMDDFPRGTPLREDLDAIGEAREPAAGLVEHRRRRVERDDPPVRQALEEELRDAARAAARVEHPLVTPQRQPLNDG